MRVMLVHPTIYGELISFHPGLISLGSYLNDRTNHRATVVDFSFRRDHWKDYFKQRIEQDKPDVIGIYTSTTFMNAVKMVIEEVREKYKLPIIVGGHHATISPDETLKDFDIDALCMNDGEYALTEYLDRIEKGESLEGLKGIYYKSNGKIFKNPKRKLISEIDTFPYQDWDLMDDMRTQLKLWGMIPFAGTRGCTNNCIFCATHAMRKAAVGDYFRPYNAKRLVDEVNHQYEKYKDSGAFLAWFFDQVFTTNKTWLKEYTDEYIRVGLSEKIHYSVFSRAEELDEDKANWLKESGCICIRIGVESGDSFQRNEVYEKNVSDEAIVNCVKLCKDKEMEITGFFMLGGPGETKEKLWKTFHFSKKIMLDTSTYLIWKPYPNTKAVDKLKEFGGVIHEDRWCEALDNFTGSIVDNTAVSATYVLWFQRMLYWYFVPRMIFRQMVTQKLKYLKYLTRYLIYSKKLGIGLYDTMRNFTYKNELRLKAKLLPKEDL
jgi:anaerobic magnesium-protoporphyrin IX monomethyl ester cyclase